MDNVKLSLTIILPGRVIMTKKDARKDIKNNYNYESVNVEWKENGKKKHEMLNIKTRKCYNVKQVINMTNEAYYAMLTEAPVDFKGKWKAIPKIEKIKMHCKDICNELGGTSFTFSIIDD